ncbi:MAG: methylenetetrahydrofolate reductase [NAD(P)H] [Bacteroidales bacterium]|nr:methylenetetrahydrofolate reductase [NAD(P)H] [Bacteroidales bacterium]
MRVIEKLQNAVKTMFSFEILPPLKGENINSIWNAIDPLMEFKPAYINITYHREEIYYKKLHNGLLEERVKRKRPGTVGISSAIMHKYKTQVVPHIICGGFTKEETEDALIDLQFLGINDVLVLRGDVDAASQKFIQTQGGHLYALDLIKQITNLNHGIFLDDEIENLTPTNFSIGVAAYPEKHMESPNHEAGIEHLKMKIDAGAEYVVTQMFFDNEKYFSFVDKCRQAGIKVPIIPGLKPISVKNHLNILPHRFHIDIPDALSKEIYNCKTNEQIRQLGIEWSIFQAKDLIKKGVASIHFFTMGKSDNIYKIAKEIY